MGFADHTGMLRAQMVGYLIRKEQLMLESWSPSPRPEHGRLQEKVSGRVTVRVQFEPEMEAGTEFRVGETIPGVNIARQSLRQQHSVIP